MYRSLLAGCTSLLLIPVLALPGASAEPQRKVVKIGVILPLTGSTATYGKDAQRAIPLLERTLNERSSRFTYQFIFEDGHCGKGSAATTAAHKLLHVDNVDGLVVGCSGEMLQVGPLAERAKTVAICFACSHPDVKNLGEYNFRTYVDIERGIENISKLMEENYGKQIAILTEENAFTMGIKKLLLKYLPDDIVFVDDFAADEADLKPLLLKAEGKGPVAYYLNPASPRAYQTLIKQMRQLGINKPVYSYHQPGDRTSLEILGQLQEGVGLP